jgi:hypothetical protein
MLTTYFHLQIDELSAIVAKDPLCTITPRDASILWQFRIFLRDHFPRSVAKLLLACPWNNRSKVQRALVLIKTWPFISPEDALELLNSNFPDAGT